MMQETTQTSGSALLYDPVIILRDILRRWYLILAFALIVGAAVRTAAEVTYRPVYASSTTFVVSSRNSTASVYQNLSRTSELASVFTEVLNSAVLRDTIVSDPRVEDFDGTISASSLGRTNLLTVRVTAADPRTAFLVSRSIIENHSVVSSQILVDVTLDVLQAPTVPMGPINSHNSVHKGRIAFVGAAGLLCLLLGFLSYHKDVIRSRREALDKLDCSCLVEVVHERKYKTLKTFLRRKKTSILLTQPAVSFRFTEAFQKLRRRVELRLGKNRKVLMFSSIQENEGKSTIVSNLALSCALAGRKTLLIDCDLRKPACWKIFQRRDFHGSTTDVLSGSKTLADSVLQDPASGLSMLLQRKTVSNASALLRGPGMAALLDEARRDYDLIILDTPPMAIGPDAEALASLSDGAVLVVQQNTTTALPINRAISSLKKIGVSVFGCVLNNMHDSGLTQSSSYGSRYGRYGHYGHYGHYGRYGAYGAYSQTSEKHGHTAREQ